MSEPLRRFEPLARWDAAFAEGEAFAAVREAAARFEAFAAFPSVEDIDRLLSPLAGVRFEAQVKTKRRRRRAATVSVHALYDGRITLEGVVPTRAGSYHDLFNALVWASFPRAKRALHRRQFHAAERRIGGPTRRLPGTRSREEDGLTMLDEGGELSLAGPEGQRRSLVFGHALLEHAHAGLAGARPRRLELRLRDGEALAPEAPMGALRGRADEALAAYLDDGGC